MHGVVGNITVLFSHCFQKKATLQGSINREIRTLSCDKTVQAFTDFVESAVTFHL